MGREDGINMKCQICGGALKYSEGLYICENCGAKQQVETFFEKTEVFICYVESDSQGRRTKDSVIAQELYNKLETAKINTFNQRISAAELTGTDFEKACTKAVNKAKVIIIAGTFKENFESLFEQYKEHFAEKKILPVYSEIDAYDLPKQFSNLQALNYDNIGAVNDLAKVVLQELGRENEIDVISAAEIKRQKRKRKFILSAGIAAILVILIGTYVVFGTPYVLKSQKYSYAEKLTESGKYAEAIAMYTELANYKNSANALKSIYDKYDGYYFDAEQKIVLHINIINDSETEISITKKINNKSVKAEIITNINGNTIDFQFQDNQGNNGDGSVILQNDGIKLLTVTEDTQAELSLGNTDYFFSMSSKSDAPPRVQISPEELISWVTTPTTKQDLFAKGYEIERVSGGCIHRIKNTDIEILLMNFTPNEETYYQEIGVDDDSRVYDDEIIRAISAPAGIIAPQKIGETANPSVITSVLYAPNANLWEPNQQMMRSNPIESKDKIIKEETSFFIAAKNSLGVYYWWELIAFEIAFKLGEDESHNIVGETDELFYVLINEQYPDERGWISIDCSGTYKLYGVNKNNFGMSLLKEEYYAIDSTRSILRQFLGELADNCILCY